MSPSLTILNVLGIFLVAMYVAGRLHHYLARDEATTIRLELATIAAVVLWLLLIATVAIALELPVAEWDLDVGILAPPKAPPPA